MEFINEKLKDIGITWYRVAKDLKIPMRTIYRWKNGQAKISNAYLKIVKNYLIEKSILNHDSEKELEKSI